jgi:hypothetical protein
LATNPAEAINVYRGEFLSDFYLVDSSEYEAWAESVRGDLNRQALFVLDELTEGAIHAEEYLPAQNYACVSSRSIH